MSATVRSEPENGETPLQRYQASMRRQRLWYVGIVAAIVVGLGVFVGVVWSRGEAAHATLHTVEHAPAPLALQPPSQVQRVAWRTSDQLAIGTMPYGGTVVTFDRRTVRGRDARTGTPTWSYTRTDRLVCTAAQLNGTTIAIYNHGGNCDEVSAFASDTGKRRWTRTLDMDAQPLNGHPSYQWTPSTLMITSPSVIYAIDPASGLNRWTYSRFGCRITAAVLGSAGALISQTCVKPRCGNLKFCGPGVQLFLRDGMAGNGDDSKADRDQMKWNHMGDADIPMSAGVLVSALDPETHQLAALQPNNGAASSVTLTPIPTTVAPRQTVELTDAQLLWLSGTTYAIQPGAGAQSWATRTVTAPTVASTTSNTPTLATARISAAVTAGLATLDGTDGAVQQTFAVPVPGPSGLVTPLGSGFLASGPNGVTAYR